MSGKGSKPRPRFVPQTEFDKNWDLIFRKPKQTKFINLDCWGTDKGQIHHETWENEGGK
jgi:hypothetical protein